MPFTETAAPDGYSARVRRGGHTRVVLAVATALLVLVGVLVAVRNGGDGKTSVDASGADATTTSSTEPTTTTTEIETVTTTTATTLASTVPVVATRRTVATTTTSTAPRTPLVLNSIRVGIGAPCHNANTTTTNHGASEHDIDGCFLFAFWPLTERDAHVALASDRQSYGGLISAPCQENESQCHAYIGPVAGERAVGERECFWLTTTDTGWQPKSNEVCINWRARPDS